MFHINAASSTILLIFAISVLGYLLGRIQIKNISLGTAGIFLIGLVFGHFGARLPEVTQTIGLVLFITAVGFSAGPGFLERIIKNGEQYAVLCLFTAAIGSVLCFAMIRLGKIDAPLAVGIMTGAYTTSPGFAAAKEAVSQEAAMRVAAGYGLIYPLGVICKVLFIQFIPRILHADLEQERRRIAVSKKPAAKEEARLFSIDKLGIGMFSLAAGLGILLGGITLPLPGGGHFALGSTGGPLIMGLLFGQIGHIRHVSLKVNPSIIAPTKELGLLLFFSGSGVEGGQGIAAILSTYGSLPLLYGFLLTILPMAGGFLLSHYVLKLPLLNGLGSMTASMTSTPSLAALTQLAQTDDVAVAYATTYPIALIVLIFVVQILVFL